MKLRGSIVIPLAALVYLIVMAALGYKNHVEHYWLIVGVSLVVIVLLYLSLRRKEKLRRRREQELEDTQYTTYNEEENSEEG